MGASETSFGPSASLELIAVDIQRSKLTPVSNIPSSHKFCAIEWGLPSRAHPFGLIASGLADGTVRIFDAAPLIRQNAGSVNDESTAVVYGSATTTKRHTGPVKSLSFNSFLPTRLATGGADGQVLVWDFNNVSAGPIARPLAESQATSNITQKEEITAIAWNRKVEHVLGTATNSGLLKVWDSNQGKRVLSIRNPRGRLRCSALEWHPEIATQIILACDEDQDSGATLWDLRNASAPVMSYTHHGPNGVSAMSWCPHDSDMLLTSSRDSRTVAVSVSTGEVLSEAPKTANWNFDVKWSPRIPGMYLSSSQDGTIAVNALMTTTTGPSVSSETANALAESFGEMAGGFQVGVQDQSPRAVDKPRVSYNLNRPPKWLKRPVSVSFGFGGRQTSLSSKGAGKVDIESFDESFSGLREACVELDTILLDMTADDPSPALRWCQQASAGSESAKDQMAWDALGMVFRQDCRRLVLKYLGFEPPSIEAGDDITMPVYGLPLSHALAIPVRSAPREIRTVSETLLNRADDIDAVTNGTGALNLDRPAPWEVTETRSGHDEVKASILDGDDSLAEVEETPTNKTNGVPGSKSQAGTSGSFVGKTREEIDVLVKKSVIVGDFKTAVEACLHVGRTADALIIAHAGGPDLWLETQAEYISNAGLSAGASIVGAIAGPKTKMDAYIRDAGNSGKESWKEALAVLMTYCPGEEISEACSSLGQRLLIAQNEAAALFCFICAGNTRMATTLWMRYRPLMAKPTSVMMADRIQRLSALVQKVRLLTAASTLGAGERQIGAVKALDEVSGSVLCEYGALLASQGDASLAVMYLSNLDANYTCMYGSAEMIQAHASEQLAMDDSATAASHNVASSSTPAYHPYNTGYSDSTYAYGNDGYSPGQAYGVASQPQYGAVSGALPPAPMAVPAPSFGATPPGPERYSSSLPPIPSNPVASRPTPPSVFASGAPSAERPFYDASAAYASVPAYGQDMYRAPPPPAPIVPAAIGAPSTGSYASPIPAGTAATAPLAPPPVGGRTAAPPIQGGTYGLEPPMGVVNTNLGLQTQSLAAPAPPPPPPNDATSSPPMSYHAKARPGSGASLPPSAEVAVAEQRRSRPMSSSGTPGGPPRRSTSTSSSLSALGSETVLLEKADVSKVPADQQVIVNSFRGAYMYALNQNSSPSYKRKMADVNKKLGRLLAGLNAGLVEAPVVELLIEVGSSIEKGNYDQATTVVKTLTKQHWDQNAQWIRGLKRLIDCVLTGR
ncbi:unnamed protein product [Chondrus crispus]|uniref:Sec16 Sec23-binding domain-containing protein n=1 Tax=Chondrus crispus TaxID=2769 RepID=R7QFG1_CHOCR|nr:unnamed protein product [Chondrus crispus]CDF36473.1 unnamed protein product [Chondrus crispus]|eukprot:XP_005716292.1 unnamed protein product [Chondrus crispus]